MTKLHMLQECRETVHTRLINYEVPSFLGEKIFI